MLLTVYFAAEILIPSYLSTRRQKQNTKNKSHIHTYIHTYIHTLATLLFNITRYVLLLNTAMRMLLTVVVCSIRTPKTVYVYRESGRSAGEASCCRPYIVRMHATTLKSCTTYVCYDSMPAGVVPPLTERTHACMHAPQPECELVYFAAPAARQVAYNNQNATSAYLGCEGSRLHVIPALRIGSSCGGPWSREEYGYSLDSLKNYCIIGVRIAFAHERVVQ